MLLFSVWILILTMGGCAQVRTPNEILASEPRPIARPLAADVPEFTKATGDVGDDMDPGFASRIHEKFASIITQRHPGNGKGVRRAVFLKAHGCAKAKFTILDVPKQFQQGIFAKPATRDAWVRISSDTVPRTPDAKNNTIGLAVKVLNASTKPKLLIGEESATTQDFLTQNHHVFFVDTGKDFMEFNDAIFDGKFDEYLAAHPTTKDILDAMEKPVSNVLRSQFWSTTPYRFGKDYAKYKIVGCKGKIPADEPIPGEDQPNYLQERLVRDLRRNGACFELQVQKRKPDMPLDAATFNWSESDSQPQTVARIAVAPQDITANSEVCENLSYTAWHTDADHRPVGSVNRARGFVYKMMGDARRQRNGEALEEPK